MIRRSSGFTLIEVMVALVILGVALPALMMNLQSVLDNTAKLEEKTYAYWIADSKLQELLITQRIEQNVTRKKKQQDSLEYGGREWFWVATVEETPTNKEFYTVTVEVGLDKDKTKAKLIGYIYVPSNKSSSAAAQNGGSSNRGGGSTNNAQGGAAGTESQHDE